MTSLEPSPPKRLKIPPPLQQPRQRPQSPSKLPTRNGSSVLAFDPTKAVPYRSPVRQNISQRSGRKTNGISSNESTGGIGKLNFGTRGGGGGGGGRFRRAGGRISESPARKSSFFNDPNAGSSVPRITSLGDGNESMAIGEEKSSPTEKLYKPRKPMKEKDVVRKRPRPKSPEEVAQEVQEIINTENEALRNLIEARVNALKMEVESLQAEVRKEEARVERDTKDTTKTGETDVEAMVKRLLSANDTSHTTLPPLPALPSLADPEIPSAKPQPSSNPLPELSVFHCLTFTSTSTTIVTTPELLDDDVTTVLPPPDDPDSLNLLQRHSTTGYASNRLLFFKLAFTVSAKDWTVQHIAYSLSPWARQELSRPLSLAAEEGNINTVLYALSSYTALAKKRALVFARLCRAFPYLLPVFVPMKDDGGKPTRREIVPWLGASVLRFKSRVKRNPEVLSPQLGAEGGVELVVSWSIELDENGEAESVVAADVRLPVYYTEVDEMKSLKKVGEMFNMLVKERGVFEGVKCVVGLVFQ